MNSLRYTNAVLTLIAAALAVIVVENIVRPSVAQSRQPVFICDIIDGTCLDVERGPAGSLIKVRAVP